jgi:hypothetical protein
MGYRPSRMHFGLAQIAESKGDKTQAIAEYRLALKIETGLAGARMRKTRLGAEHRSGKGTIAMLADHRRRASESDRDRRRERDALDRRAIADLDMGKLKGGRRGWRGHRTRRSSTCRRSSATATAR